MIWLNVGLGLPRAGKKVTLSMLTRRVVLWIIGMLWKIFWACKSIQAAQKDEIRMLNSYLHNRNSRFYSRVALFRNKTWTYARIPDDSIHWILAFMFCKWIFWHTDFTAEKMTERLNLNNKNQADPLLKARWWWCWTTPWLVCECNVIHAESRLKTTPLKSLCQINISSAV